MFFTTQILGLGGQALSGRGLVAVAAAFCVLLALGGCGQKGPLYMPLPAQQVPPPGLANPVVTLPALAAPVAPASAAR